MKKKAENEKEEEKKYIYIENHVWYILLFFCEYQSRMYKCDMLRWILKLFGKLLIQ